MRTLLIPTLIATTTLIQAAMPASASACPDLSGLYQLPAQGQCGTRDLSFTLPIYSETQASLPTVADGLRSDLGGTLEITQSGCEKILLTLKSGTTEITTEFQAPSHLAAQQTANQGTRAIRWDSGGLFDSASLEISHDYRSSLYSGGVFNGPTGPVQKTWFLSKKYRNGSIDILSRLDYSSFHHAYTNECKLTPLAKQTR